MNIAQRWQAWSPAARVVTALIAIDDYDMLSEDDEFPLLQTTLMGLAKRGWLVGVHILLAGFNVACPEGGINGKANHIVHGVGRGDQHRRDTPAERQKIQSRFVGSGCQNLLLRAEA